jgi:hypothetical protein
MKIPNKPPMALKIIEVKVRRPTPHKVGRYPPASEPTVIPIIIKTPLDMILL